MQLYFAAPIMIFYALIALKGIRRETPRKRVVLLSLIQMHSQSIVIHLSTKT